MTIRNVLFRRRFPRYNNSLNSFGISSEEFATALAEGLSLSNYRVVPNTEGISIPKYGIYPLIKGYSVYAYRLVGKAFSVEDVELSGREARFRIIDGEISVPKNLVNHIKEVLKNRHPSHSRHFYKKSKQL